MKITKFNIDKEIMATICIFRLDTITIVERFSLQEFDILINQYQPLLSNIKLIYEMQIKFSNLEYYEFANICKNYIINKKQLI